LDIAEYGKQIGEKLFALLDASQLAASVGQEHRCHEQKEKCKRRFPGFL